MAGGKETPRQKMIGLMYLVLTAMLALNVDSAVLDRFIQINQALEQQNIKFRSENEKTIGAIKEKVSERGDKPEEVKVLNTAQEVRSQTASIMSYIENLKQKLITETGGFSDSIAKTMEGAQDMDHIATMMIQQKKGDTLKNLLNNYAAYLSELTNDTAKFKPIALDGRDDPYYSLVRNQRDKNFSQLYFESTPAAGGLASFSQLQSKVMDYETEALEYLAGQVGATDVSFDNIVPLVVPESKFVAAGARFKAEMYAAASASNVTPSMTWGGNSIPVNEKGVGTVEFKASAAGAKYDKDGRIARSVQTKININGQEYQQNYEYFVIKPTVQIQSAAIQQLYLNCGNELFVNVPALGEAYNPTFRGQGGQAIKGNERNKVMCVPTGQKFTLSVINDGSLIDDVEFNVRRIPKPDIVLKGDGSDVNEKQGVSTPPRELTLIAVPDEDFRSALPKDARYRVSEWEVIWARGSRAMDRQTVSGTSFRLPAGWRQMRSGDRIVIEVKGVQRKNFQEKTENVVIGVGQRIKQIPIS